MTHQFHNKEHPPPLPRPLFESEKLQPENYSPQQVEFLKQNPPRAKPTNQREDQCLNTNDPEKPDTNR